MSLARSAAGDSSGPALLDALEEILAAALRRAGAPPRLDPLERGEREDELAPWLDGCGVGESWELGPALTAWGVDVAMLEALAEA